MKTITSTNGYEILVDDEDFERVNEYRWWVLSRTKEVYTRVSSRKPISIHRFIMSVDPGFMIDHINGNRLDNRKCNLRVCTNAQNQMNRPAPIVNTSGFKGVSFISRERKYEAHIGYNGKAYHLGYFTDPKQAAQAYNKAAKALHGEFAYLNDV